MSVAAMTAVWRYSQAPDSTSLFILVAMADWADEEGYCFPSHRALAEKTGASLSAVKRAIRQLQKRGEVELVSAKGHTVPTPREFVGRTGFKPTNLYRITLVDQLGSKRPEFLERNRVRKTPVRADRSEELGSGEHGNWGQASTVTGVRAEYAYKEDTQEDTQEDTSGEEGEAAAPPTPPVAPQPEPGKTDPVDAFRELWNATISEPLKPCLSLTKRRRRWIRACLTERPLEAWREVFERATRSRICRGERPGGWVMSFDQLIGSPDTAVRLLEGQWDNREPVERPFSAQELADARRVRANAVGCPHQERCATPGACEAVIIRKWRRDRGEAA